MEDSQHMKNDIIESMNIILHESSEQEYRPIMDNYKTKLRDYRNLGNKQLNELR